MIGNIVISEIDALTYVVLSEAEKYMPYGELVGTPECLTLYLRCCTNLGRYNRIQLYLIPSHLNFGSSKSATRMVQSLY
jgi:hypothetical protein